MYLSSVAPLETDVLTLQVCVQVCRGRHVDVAAAWRGQCYCFSNIQMSLTSRTEIRRCDTACPGDNDQRCGDEFGQYLNLLDMRQYEDVAGTCADLYRQGVRIPGPYLLHRDEDSSPLVQNCFYTELRVNAVPRLELAPEDWQYWRGNFYQFLVASQNVFSVDNAGCFKEGGGYLTSVLSQDELDFIATTIRGSPLFAPVDQWLVGLTDVTQSGSLRWAGPVLFDNNPPFSNQCTAATLCCVVRTDDSVILRDCYRTPNTTWGYICKQERGFRGCRRLHLTSMEFLHIADSGDMTALLCKELCRGNLSELAVVSGEDCYCVTEIPSSTELMTPDHCDIPCSGHADQMCAGGGLALWYNVDKDKVESVELATDCDQFLYNGFNTSDTLLLRVTADNGQETLTHSACGKYIYFENR
ncbi:uncharacterized protein LOC124146825 [Haliotis rufescens]|uniref:uncharacterized protein LOC124146825 n=1 Tax=Haliotis rufescens TaxID=6454 RepID=UPI00201EA363|nr:uncharacterized protein LOC124146825 [Haliotis rufescens]